MLLALALLVPLCADPGDAPLVLPLREQAALRDRWLAARLETVVPRLMRREGIDLWIVASREYAEDPLFSSLSPATWLRARRRTLLVFHDPGPEHSIERLAVSRYPVGDSFAAAWEPEEEPDQWARLAALVAERDPARIAVNRSETFALADGLSAAELGALERALPERLRARIVSGERLALGWLETRTADELEVYPSIVRIAHSILAEGLSARAVQPGHTTTEDLQWWYRERIAELGLATWFHPSVSVQRAEGEGHSGSFATREGVRTIRRGDLVHVDFGITYLGLNTDTQQHAYVLRAGEEHAPAGLVRALARGNRLQDILTAQFATGRTGNEILRAALAQARAEGLRPSIYTHPLGFHGHGAGPTIGLWDRQDGVSGTGDYPLYPMTAYAIELNVTEPIPEWGDADVRIMLEEDAVFDGERVRYLDGRQTELLLIR